MYEKNSCQRNFYIDLSFSLGMLLKVSEMIFQGHLKKTPVTKKINKNAKNCSNALFKLLDKKVCPNP
jgi:hypothetical protein